MNTIQEFVTIKEAAKVLGVSPLTLRRWDNKGKLVTRRHPINRYRLYDRKKLSQFLKSIND